MTRQPPIGCTCGRRWTGLSQAHCTTCHEHFGSVHGFDRHRGTGRCADPATVTRRDGKPFYRAQSGPHGTTWVQHTDRIHPGKARRLAEKADA